MSLDAILKQYEKNNSSKATKKMSNDEMLKQYFSTFLPDGVNSATKKIRILPVPEGESPFKEIMGHKSQVGGQWRTFVCPKHANDDKCPYCEAREGLLATGEDSDKELAKDYSARKLYVVKLIDRAKEDEGPKFWRFNHDFRKTGIFDKIYGVLMAIQESKYPSITDSENGRDLIITINRDQNNRPTVSSIVQADPSPLHTNPDVVAEWTKDDRGWEDVYKVKGYQYLEIIVKGGEPVWKKDASGEGGEWVDKNSLTEVEESNDIDDDSNELTIGATDSQSVESTITSTDEVEEEEDDLPF